MHSGVITMRKKKATSRPGLATTTEELSKADSEEDKSDIMVSNPTPPQPSLEQNVQQVKDGETSPKDKDKKKKKGKEKKKGGCEIL